MNKKLVGALIGLTVLGVSSAASAHVDLAIGVGIPAPVYVAPQPVYVAPPAPAYAAPVAVGYYRGDDWREREWRRREWREHEWREHQWRERRWGGYGY
ncbi:hypothetical protein GWC77_12205 [Paraburkholderia sp. NMBU_R16]|uniref:hypothetical protein n=1 Tax=Paraburkholderia sp. NMBU_R16 TaxID=2698676 RepID=UPI0015647B45|nr:hypothetical protein [Paraburkholderia sp. NMBU_R16]NRO96683.1 hypothetical protein [Paraburkholderia sp. NMBU_R16]